jgi:RHS repeat-associated protein
MGDWQFTYDAEGARIAKGTLSAAPAAGALCAPIAANGGGFTSSQGFALTNRFLVDLGGQQATEFTEGSGELWLHSNVFSGGRLSATYDRTGLHYELADPLGTKRVQASVTGAIENRWTSLPFGNDLNNPPSYSTPDATEHHFTQKERDAESGNDYFFARYYTSALGRFTTPDWSAKEEPVPYAQFDDPQSLNLYAYVRNNPIVHMDPDGHQDKKDTCPPGSWCAALKWAWEHGHQDNNPSQKHNGALVGDKDRAKQGLPRNGSSLSAYPKGSTYCGDFVCSSDGHHLGVAPAEIQGVRSDEYLADALMFVPVEKLAAPLARAATKLGGDLAGKAAETFFARGGKGLLNSNDFFRIGYGWQGSATAGSNVFRVGIGSKRMPIHIHITLWKF